MRTEAKLLIIRAIWSKVFINRFREYPMTCTYRQVIRQILYYWPTRRLKSHDHSYLCAWSSPCWSSSQWCTLSRLRAEAKLGFSRHLMENLTAIVIRHMFSAGDSSASTIPWDNATSCLRAWSSWMASSASDLMANSIRLIWSEKLECLLKDMVVGSWWLKMKNHSFAWQS